MTEFRQKDDGMLTALPRKLLLSNRWLLLAMLVSLHLALWLGVDNIWVRPILLSHLGFFLLWQPLWRGERELSFGGVTFIAGASAMIVLWLNWWMLAFWLAGLFALVGGRVFAFQSRWLRILYLAVMAYLLAALLLWVAPYLFAVQGAHLGVASMHLDSMGEGARSIVSAVLLFFLAGVLFVPVASEQAESAHAVDFIYSLLLFMLLTLLVLGSLAFMTLASAGYLEALLRTLFLMALVLFALAWLWNPRFGFTGLQPLFSRYVLNVGTPFESWLRQLSETAQREQSPTAFLEQATVDLAALPWLSGVSWRVDKDTGSIGKPSQHLIEVEVQDLRLTLFSKQAIAPSMLLHIHLLTELLGHFYQAKRREQRLREVTRLQAVYETGARLTHDLKNMLQSLLALTAIAQSREQNALPLLWRQLPVLTQRIELALSKLKAPQQEGEAALQPLAAWWENLRQRHQHEAITWECAGAPAGRKIPATLFDCVADNLIDNAANKRLQQPGIPIRVTLCGQPLSLSVCDGGSAIPAPLARQLLQTVVPSENGLGIGLYQAARWSQQLGYQLVLRENTEGAVRFELADG
ncbi:MAG: HAMP domain-containing histidine kinase [Nitrosomonadales bacterium]|nr:HAMP domain-containing histidine kinase [Nitrosomonadales bacterium]